VIVAEREIAEFHLASSLGVRRGRGPSRQKYMQMQLLTTQ
jgi:hypothetical protein